MLWLRKRLDDQLIYANQTSGEYIRNEMISYADYKQFIEQAPLTDCLEKDIKWKAFQLVDIFFHCMIIYKWIVIPTEKGKLKFFKTFSNPEKLKEYVSFSDLLPSKQIDELPTKIHENLIQTFNEVLNDFSKEYKYAIKMNNRNHLLKRKDYLLYANKNVSFILYGGLWSALRVLPKDFNYLGELIFDNKIVIIPDCIDTPLWTINEYEIPEKEIKDKPEFLKKTVIQSIEYYINIQKLYFEKLNTEEYLKQKYYFFNACEADIKEQFLTLLQDFNFVAIKNNCPEFQDYCYVLMKARILKYENSILQGTSKDSWGDYYIGCFIHDENLELHKHIQQINNFYRNLFDRHKKKDLDDVRPYSATSTGYDKLIKETIIPRLNELKISRNQK